MAFVKLDCGMLDSTTWFDKDGRDIFITSLLMATPKDFTTDQKQLEINSLKETGWTVPKGWYGFVDAASLGIINRCGIPIKDGVKALERLGSPEGESRSQQHDGRRMVRIDGGFVILNYINYREKDHTAAERQRRFRERHKAKKNTNSNAVTKRYITQAEVEAEVEAENINTSAWETYLEHRKELRVKKLTPRGEKIAKNKLAKLSYEDQLTVIEITIANGWTGLFPNKLSKERKSMTYSEQLMSDMVSKGMTEGADGVK